MARHRDLPLPRLTINSGQQVYSPALPSAVHQAFHPQFPIQPFFNPQPPQTPGRSIHHQTQQSIVHLTSAGIHPSNAFPMTPMAGHFPRPSVVAVPPQGQPSGPPFPHRNRRQLSIGGPPKAVLGGPARKLSPLPIAPAINSSPAPPKVKKLNVNLPKETILGDDGQPLSRPSWARTPLRAVEFTHQYISRVEIFTAELYPTDNWAKSFPNTLDVFLPGKVCLITFGVTPASINTHFSTSACMG